MFNKKSLRIEALDKRKNLLNDEIEANSKIIVQKVLNFLSQKKFDSIFSFCAIPGEVDLSRLIGSVSVPLAYPRIVDHRLEFYKVDSHEQLKKQSFGILEPWGQLELIHPSPKSVILVPALLLSRDGARLGMGKGFYDRFLADYPDCLSIGVIFDQFLVESLPMDPWDINLYGVCTERRLDIWR